MILIGIFSAVLLWCDLSSPYIWVLIFIVSGLGLLGAYDDYKKIKLNNFYWISFKFKIVLQILIAVFGILILINFTDNSNLQDLYFPFFKDLIINLGSLFLFQSLL